MDIGNLDELVEKYYEKFKTLPNDSPIVRQNQKNDAFEIVVLETLYGKEKGIDVSKLKSTDVDKISKYIVSPQDDGIDIVVEHDNIDGSTYDFVQVKNSELTQLEIKQAILYMKKTISTYLKKPSDVHKNLKVVLAETNFSKSDKSSCRYILVHRGVTNYFKGQEKNEQVITGSELETIRDGERCEEPRVHEETFEADSFNNFSSYEESHGNPAILMNLRGYDLAKLAVKYTNTSLGRNILFGQNLRDSLSKSKTYDGMVKTIRSESEKFWFYNNGITVIAEDYDVKTKSNKKGCVEKITLKEFSIINGAQTTSALGKFLKNAEMDNNENDIEHLKKVYVLTRILKVTDDAFKSQIAIYNNTQNPITTRDMASNREEQKKLYQNLLEGDVPNIYMEIRRGMTPPNNIKLYEHQHTTNVELAQLSYAGFERDPFTAKDKKNSIFDTDYKQEEFLLNETYDKLFRCSPTKDRHIGILFKKSKEEINELLFVYYLYKLSKKMLISYYKKKIEETQKNIEECDDNTQKDRFKKSIVGYERRNAIANICVFYCVAYYYGFKENFSKVDKEKVYKYNAFYSDKSFRESLIKKFCDLFLNGTIEIIKEVTKNYPNLNTWVRDKKSKEIFLDKFDDKIQANIDLETVYTDYVNKYKDNV